MDSNGRGGCTVGNENMAARESCGLHPFRKVGGVDGAAAS